MIDDPVILLIVLPLAAYVVGATPFGVILSRAKGVDIRTQGSGNTGAWLSWTVRDVLKSGLRHGGWCPGHQRGLVVKLLWIQGPRNQLSVESLARCRLRAGW